MPTPPSSSTPPSAQPEPPWTLKQLTAQVALALSEADVDQHSGRVRDIPNARTIRYYGTLGLVDKPSAFRGRTALYTRRHLLQLVAIKRLQAQGTSLDAIQAQLTGATDAELTQLAKLPEAPPARAAPAPSREGPSRRLSDFWGHAPAPVAPVEQPPPPAPAAQPPPQPEPTGLESLLQGVPLSPELTLLLHRTQRPLEPADLEAIQAAAAPLLALLKARHLLP